MMDRIMMDGGDHDEDEYDEEYLPEEIDLQGDNFGFDGKEAEPHQFISRPMEIPGIEKGVKFKRMAAGASCYLIVTERNTIIRWRFNDDPIAKEYPLPDRTDEEKKIGVGNIPGAIIAGVGGILKKIPYGDDKSPTAYTIDKIFIDPKGNHALLTSETTGDTVYFNIRADIPKYCSRLRGIKVLSVAWDETAGEESTKELLLGTDGGQILSYKLDWLYKENEVAETPWKQLFKLPYDSAIQNMEAVTFKEDNNKNAIIIATTASQLYTFVGAANFEILFDKYSKAEYVEQVKASATKFYRGTKSIMHVHYRKEGDKPHSFIWTNGHNLACFKFPERNVKNNDGSWMKDGATVLKFSKKAENEGEHLKSPGGDAIPEMPRGIALSEYHYFLLFEDGLTILSRITEQVVDFIDLKKHGHMIGMNFDRSSQTLYVYGSKYIGEIKIDEEDRDIWRVYLEMKKYQEAYDICKKYNNPAADFIAGQYADYLFSQGKYEEAAKHYANTNRSFEEIALKFNEGPQDYLITYLEAYLKRLSPAQMKTQKTLILSWLTELQVVRMNLNEKTMDAFEGRPEIVQEYRERLGNCKNKFKTMLKENLTNLDEGIVYQVLQSHGRLSDWVYFAQQKDQNDMLIIHYLHEEQWTKAIERIKAVQKENVKLDIIYRFCHLLMRYEPEMTIDLLKTNVPKYDLVKLIPGFMNIQKPKRDVAIKFLAECREKTGIKDKVINNIYIFFLTEKREEKSLLEYLKGEEDFYADNKHFNFDLDFALRLLKQNNLSKPMVKIYSMMGLYEEAVSLALKNGDMGSAKEVANKPEGDDLKKKLWLQITISRLKNNDDIQSILKMTEEAENIIKIDDILPHMNENIKIQEFRGKICDSLQNYNEEITSLRGNMEGYSQNAEQLKQELRVLKTKYIEVDAEQKCERCTRPIIQEEFYAFPCVHSYHKSCLLKTMRETSNEPAKLAKVEELDRKISDLVRKGQLSAISQPTAPQTAGSRESRGFSLGGWTDFFMKKESATSQRTSMGLSASEERDLKLMQEEFDKRVARDCPLCGFSIVDSIYQQFDPDSMNRRSWEI